MKIPYPVSTSSRQAYETSKEMMNSPGEEKRKIVAENFEWDDDFTPAPLTYIAAVVLSKLFNRINPLPHILQKDIDILMDLYPEDIQLKLSIPYIQINLYPHLWEMAAPAQGSVFQRETTESL